VSYRTGVKTPRARKGVILLITISAWALLSCLALFIIWGIRDRARLIRDNDNERIFNSLFTSFRDYDDIGSAIDSNQVLRERVAGFAIYRKDLSQSYCWGAAPQVFDLHILDNHPGNRFGRYTIQDQKGRRVLFVLHFERPPLAPNKDDGHHRRGPPPESSVSTTLANGEYIYIDIRHPVYWHTRTITAIFFVLYELGSLVLVFSIRHLYLRNREYRERIEAQKNLVVLGTAASTLAHEIKNPLLSIRLQTGILRKLFPGTGSDELGIIDEEAERISALIYRVNDYLREAQGNQTALNMYGLLLETSRRLCGRDIIRPGSIQDAVVYMDADRARSVLENVLRNALEAGGPEEDVAATIGRDGGFVVISVLDRGKGLGGEDLKRVFDPFFTKKSVGTGIGLSISKRFVEAVGGTIELENRQGGGMEVRISLPEHLW
jgi:two-component system sensor histidine kinase HydH